MKRLDWTISQLIAAIVLSAQIDYGYILRQHALTLLTRDADSLSVRSC